MAISISDLIKGINTKAAVSLIEKTGESGFLKTLNVPGIKASSAQSFGWFIQQAKTVREETLKLVSQSHSFRNPTTGEYTVAPSATQVISDGIHGDNPNMKRPRINQRLRAGDLIMYQYDPKTKDKLPYYDIFPLVFTISVEASGFLGLNMHYLPPTSRAILMDALYSTLNNTLLNEDTRLMVNYEILKGSKKFREFRPCIKRYLYDHIRSSRLTVEPKDWEAVLFLPLAKFVKADQLKVWDDSLAKIRGVKKI
jgi:hypothetical protein